MHWHLLPVYLLVRRKQFLALQLQIVVTPFHQRALTDSMYRNSSLATLSERRAAYTGRICQRQFGTNATRNHLRCMVAVENQSRLRRCVPLARIYITVTNSESNTSLRGVSAMNSHWPRCQSTHWKKEHKRLCTRQKVSPSCLGIISPEQSSHLVCILV